MFMLNLKDAVPEWGIHDYLKHLYDIMCECRDGTEWRQIRTWSQAVLDKVEDGEID